MASDPDSGIIANLFKVGAHFGYSRSRRHASMKPFIFGSKGKTDIIDLEKATTLVATALAFAHTLGAQGKVVLFVGGKSEIRDMVQTAADEISMPYVSGRWLGGTLSNFSEIKKRIKKLIELTTDRDSGALAKKFTKLEQVMIGRDIARLEENFGGIVSLEKLPDALVIVDTRAESIAAREARGLGIPVIGIMNSDCDLSLATHPIVGNDASRESVQFFLNEIVRAYRDGQVGAATPSTAQ